MRKIVLIILTLTIFTFSCKKIEHYDRKVLNVISTIKINGFDPIHSSDHYSSAAVANIYDGLYQYHYLERPYKLIPNLAADMPAVSEDGLTYTIPLKKGVYFHDNECFKNGKGREFKAQDVVYSLKRLSDPNLQSPGWDLLRDRIVGLDEWHDLALKNRKADYATIIEGLKAIDDYTLQFQFTTPYPQFLYSLAMTFTYIVPQEAVDFYGEDFLNNPVGTGAFTLSIYRSNRMVYKKNPNYRTDTYPTTGEPEDVANNLLKDAGKQLPLVDEIVVTIQKESLPAWLLFERGRADYFGIPKDQFDQVISPDKNLTDAYKKKGISLLISPSLDITYTAFNMEDPLFKNNVLLRRAISMAYNMEEISEVFYNNQVIKAQSMLPPGIAGYDKNYINPYREYNVEKAKKLLAEAGYPNGKGLPPIEYLTVASTASRQMAEFFVKSMADIGVVIKINAVSFPELLNIVNKRKAQMFGMAWGADFPDAENFLKLFYSKNVAPGPNSSNYNNPEFDRLFIKACNMQDTPERTALYEQLNQMIAEDMPIIFGAHRIGFRLKHSWVENFKPHDFNQGMSKYYNINLEEKKFRLDSL